MTPLVNFETAGAPEGLLTLRTLVGFLSAVWTHVHSEMTRTGKTCWAQLTLEWSLTRVGTFVGSQRGGMSKHGPTQVTLVGFLISVAVLIVWHQLRKLGELFPTHLTGVGGGNAMGQHMISQTTDAGKWSATLLTQKCLLARVGSLVHGQVLCSRVSFAAKAAGVGLLATVLPHVQLEAAWACEGGATLLAQKGFESRVRMLVLLQVIRLGEASPTGVTGKGSLSCVGPQVDLQLRRVNECSAAESTREAAHTCVSLHVNF